MQRKEQQKIKKILNYKEKKKKEIKWLKQSNKIKQIKEYMKIN